MNRTILASSLLAVALVGCSGRDDGPQTAVQDATTAPVQVAEAPVEPCNTNPFYSPLPDAAIRFDFPFRVARDRVYSSDNDTLRRGISLEYLEGDGEGRWNDVIASMQKAGFEQTNASTDSPLSGTFKKPGQPGIFVKVSPEPGKNPTGDDVKGSVWLSWTVEEAPSAP